MARALASGGVLLGCVAAGVSGWALHAPSSPPNSTPSPERNALAALGAPAQRANAPKLPPRGAVRVAPSEAPRLGDPGSRDEAVPQDEAAPLPASDATWALEPYTGDPAGQALLDELVETEQQTIQPEDLVEEPPPPRLELHKLPAYQAEHMDADGNLN